MEDGQRANSVCRESDQSRERMSCGLDVEPESVLCRGQKITDDMKKIAITIAMVCLCAGSARASINPGAPDDQGGSTYILYGPQQSPAGQPGTSYNYFDNGTYSTYQLILDNVSVVNGDVILLDSGSSSLDRANWSDVLTFSEPDSMATLTSYEGSDAATFWNQGTWAAFVPSDNAVYIEETVGPYTIYNAFNDDSGASITYQITPQIHNVVPEPTTMIVGVLLLLPFGVSTLRILRKSHAA